MQVLLKIGGVNKSSSLRADSLRIESVITKQIDTCRFTLTGEHTLTEGSDEVIISNVAETTRYFAGYIARVKRGVEGITKLHLIDCQDYSVLLDAVLVNKVFVDKTDAYILNALFAEYLPEINAVTYVETGKTHDRIVLNRVTLRAVVDMLAEDSALDWYVDYSKNLHYFTPAANAAPFGISDSPDNVTTFPCSRLDYEHEATKLINLVTIEGGFYKSEDISFEIPGNAQTLELLLPYKMHGPVAGGNLLVYKNTGSDVTPTWTAQGVGIDHVDTLGGGIDVLLNFDEKLLKFASAPPNLKRAVKATGRYDVPVLVKVRSTASYALYGRWYEDKIIDQTIDSRDWAKLRGKGILAGSAFAKERGSFTCLQDGLTSGQLIYIVNAKKGLDGYYLINRLTTRILGGTQCEYTAQFGEYNPDLVDILLGLKRQAVQYRARREDEVLTELFEQEEDLALAEATDIHSDDFSSGLVNRWIALPPTQGAGHNVQHEALALAEAPAITDHEKNNYLWDAADFRWDFASWG